MDFDQDSNHGRRNRTVVFSVLGLVTIGVLLGLLVGGLGLAAVRTVDVGSDDSPTSQASEESDEPTSDATDTEPTEDETTTTVEPDESDATLVASPTEVGSYEEIDLSGSFPELGPGVTLQVQRRESGTWTDFPVTATTGEGGTFATFVQTGVLGTNKFRMMALDTGETTPTVKVEVG
uniref:Uncharacterized protein n=1 Tax=uncultured Nocardioidaceae bacterium TaxID=253824 RepID=A0A6J4LH03_9ACTN|nr:MAG: hypothetical protein AVDCRST_MAG46-1529 [uncultured Nocardioidaceae bacterium]